MDLLILINSKIGAFVWGPVMLTLLLGTGLYLSVRGDGHHHWGAGGCFLDVGIGPFRDDDQVFGNRPGG